MTATRRMLAALVLGTALVARPALGQQGSSVSLTHTVSVTVPPRVKVQVGTVAATTTSSTQSGALSVSVSATQAWVLSIGSAKSSKLQWSSDAMAGYAGVSPRDAMIASGQISQTPAAATLFFRNAAAGSTSELARGDGSEPIILTVVAP
jgi:hypothetical protein